MKKERFVRPRLGDTGKTMMKRTLPLVLVQVILTAIYLGGRDTYALSVGLDTATALFRSIGMSLCLSVTGGLFFDAVEKREKRGNP